MERLVDLTRVRFSDRLLETARTAMVLLCAAALIAAGRVLPF